MIIEDFTMLGKTVPEPARRDNQLYVCSAGISPELGLVRIYRLPTKFTPKRWNTYRVPVERDRQDDSRDESFKVQKDKWFQHVGKSDVRQLAPILNRFSVGSIKEANEKRMSLAILHPSHMSVYFRDNPDSPDSPILSLFDVNQRTSTGAKRFPHSPRMRFYDDLGERDLMIRDWGCYEWMRKQPDRYQEMKSTLHLNDESSLLIGNFNQIRTQWLIISVINGLRTNQPTLFDTCPDTTTG